MEVAKKKEKEQRGWTEKVSVLYVTMLIVKTVGAYNFSPPQNLHLLK